MAHPGAHWFMKQEPREYAIPLDIKVEEDSESGPANASVADLTSNNLSKQRAGMVFKALLNEKKKWSEAKSKEHL